MRIVTFIFIFLAVSKQSASQLQQPVFVGNSSWEKVANQKVPDPLPVTEHKVWMNKTFFPDEKKAASYRKIDPGTITIRTGATSPVVQSYSISGKKLAAPEKTDAMPLETRDNAEL